MPISKGYKKNFETLQRAFRNNQVCLLEAQDKSTGEIKNLLCAVSEETSDEFTFVPFAVMIDGNPYDMYNPPKPEGGFDVD